MDRPTLGALGVLLSVALATPSLAQPVAVEGPHMLLSLGLVNLVQVELGELAMERAVSPRVRALGERERRDHRFALRRVVVLADQLDVRLPLPAEVPAPEALPEPMRDVARGLRDLRRSDGSTFDAKFLNLMVASHEALDEMLDRIEDGAPYEPLRELAGDLDPVVGQHRELALRLAANP
jgi:putative membrane protein